MSTVAKRDAIACCSDSAYAIRLRHDAEAMAMTDPGDDRRKGDRRENSDRRKDSASGGLKSAGDRRKADRRQSERREDRS